MSESVSQSVTRSPIELFWTAKKKYKYLFADNKQFKQETNIHFMKIKLRNFITFVTFV